VQIIHVIAVTDSLVLLVQLMMMMMMMNR